METNNLIGRDLDAEMASIIKDVETNFDENVLRVISQTNWFAPAKIKVHTIISLEGTGNANVERSSPRSTPQEERISG